jgi:hypothetical protein
MRRNWLFALLFAPLWIGLAACGGVPATPQAPVETAAPDASGARTLSIPTVGGKTSVTHHGPLKWDLPSAWTESPPSSNMRLAQYSVPGSGGNGECVVFYFGPGQGGDPLANAQRWAGQFSQPDGSNPLDKMTMQKIDGGSLALSLVEVTGTYEGGMSTGTTPAKSEPGWMLLGGIATGPDAPWFFKMTGPQATIEENREAFVGMLRSIRQEI